LQLMELMAPPRVAKHADKKVFHSNKLLQIAESKTTFRQPSFGLIEQKFMHRKLLNEGQLKEFACISRNDIKQKGLEHGTV